MTERVGPSAKTGDASGPVVPKPRKFAHREVAVWNDIAFACVFEWDDHQRLEWELVEFAHVGEDSTPVYFATYDRNEARTTENIEHAQSCARGFVRGDGPMVWTWAVNSVSHGRREDIDDLAEALHRIRDKAIANGGIAALIGLRKHRNHAFLEGVRVEYGARIRGETWLHLNFAFQATVEDVARWQAALERDATVTIEKGLAPGVKHPAEWGEEPSK